MSALVIENEDGRVLLELDDHGQVVVRDESIRLENRIPERIEDAAKGGVTLAQLGDKALLCADVDIEEYGRSWVDEEWVRLSAADGDTFEALSKVNLSKLAGELNKKKSTLRCVIFEADLVNHEGEPELREWHDFAAELRASGFAEHPEVMEAVLVDDSPGGYMSVMGRLCEHFGVDHESQIDPAALYLWACDRGIADHLPESYKTALHHEDDVNG